MHPLSSIPSIYGRPDVLREFITPEAEDETRVLALLLRVLDQACADAAFEGDFGKSKVMSPAAREDAEHFLRSPDLDRLLDYIHAASRGKVRLEAPFVRGTLVARARRESQAMTENAGRRHAA